MAEAKTERVALFDNIKGILIILVVFGHVMHPVHNSNPALSTCFDVIYLFHMPLFVLVSGLFAKGAYRDGKLNVNRIISFALLGFAYQYALALINETELAFEQICLFTSAPWYLISMAFWYLCTPALARLGAKRGMAVSLAAALLWGLVDMSDGFLAISRTLAFLPCFALGYYLKPEEVARMRDAKLARLAIAVSALIILTRMVNPRAYEWFFPMVYGDNPYKDGLAFGILQKLTSLGIGAVFSLSVLRLAPDKSSWLTMLGQRTLQVYVLHRLIRAWLTFRTPFYDLPVMDDPILGTLIVAALSIAIIAICAIPVLEKPFARLLKIRWTHASS